MRYLAKIILLAVVYFVTAKIGLAIQPVGTFATLVWAPTGIALTAVLLLGARAWPGIFAAALAANLLSGAPVAVAAGIAAGNTLEALLGAYALRRIPGFRPSLDRLQDVLGLLLLGGALSTLVSATIGVASLAVGGVLPASQVFAAWRTWWLGDAIGDFVVAPLLLTWKPVPEAPRMRSRVAALEAGALFLLTGLASFWIFERTTGGMVSLLTPLFVWAALRFGQRGAARASFVVSAIGLWATARGHGPFLRETIPQGLFALQVFMTFTSGTFLVLGVVISERRRADEERRRAEEKIRTTEARYRTITEAVDHYMWINDAQGRTTYVNPRVTEVFGALSLDHPAPASVLMHAEELPVTFERRRQAIAAGEAYGGEFRMRGRDGSDRWILIRVVPVKDDQGRVTSWIGSGADIHDLKTAEAELRRAKEEAESANRAKDHFLATLSHELRTPLTPVLAISSALEEDRALPAETRRQIEVVRRNAELEARLIDDLLDSTLIARGKLSLEREPAEVGSALEDVLQICRHEAAEKGLRLERGETGNGKFVYADPARLRQVFWNLVRNAIKFTPRGGRITLREGEALPGRIAIEVSDTGSGIEPGQLSRIFRPFEQAGEKPGGLGLGLAISNALVQAHGGTLTAASEGRGRGATFRVELALSGFSPTPEVQRAVSRAASPGPVRRILLVEDHSDTLAAARDLLSELSCDVVSASSVEEALAAAGSRPFDLVISDIGLADGNGFDLMRRLRERHGLSGIAITGYGMESDVRRSREAGFVEHLVKPITFQRLAGAIDRFFDARAS
jgi:PAS domain S-box-containing protein